MVKNYPGEAEYNEENNTFEIPFSEADTWLFAEDELFYMDIKLTLANGQIPETPIITLRMHSTLFNKSGGNNEETSLVD